MYIRSIITVLAVTLALSIGCGRSSDTGTVEITYWRHHYSSEDNAIRLLIRKFEAEHPGITVNYQSMPYKGFREKLDTALHAGKGPDIINIHNSWVYPLAKGNRLLKIPARYLPSENMEHDYIPLAGSFSINEEYYGLPIGGGCLALFINTDHLKALQLDPTAYPADWKELEKLALKLTIKSNGRVKRTGFACGGIKSQSWNYLVEGLFRQNGCEITSDDGKSVLWNTPEGIEAFTWYTDFVTRHNIFNLHFDRPVMLFIEGTASMIVDLNVITARIKEQTPNLSYAVYPLPGKKNRATYGSCWGNCVTASCPPGRQNAAFAFISFLASERSAETWTEMTGEVPLQKTLLNDPGFREKHSDLLPFIDSMPFAGSALKKDEGIYKNAIIRAIEQVILKNVSPASALNEAASEINRMLEER